MTVSFDVSAAAAYLEDRLGPAPGVAVVLGSGLATLVEEVEGPVRVPFDQIPGYPPPGVAGHAGEYVAGELGGVRVLFQCGRFHRYEGHPADVVAGPVRVARAIGVDTLILTNAAGGIRRDLEPGAIMMLDDHINWMFSSPLAGPVHEAETRFPDMSRPYDPELAALARGAAVESGMRLEEGVYAAVLGPAYETPAEIRMLERLGADVVGMSTVPEVLVARALGLRCLGFSVVTNRAAGLGGATLDHDEVIQVGRSAAERLGKLLTRLVREIGAGYPASAK